MTVRHLAKTATARLLVEPFPTPGPEIQLAYRELNLAMNGTPEQQEMIGDPARLPRPWEPATCIHSGLRLQLWDWLDEVVIWLNRGYSWDATGAVPTCWPLHPHLVHEIAVVADQRRRAGLAVTSDALEEWHRYCLPPFIDRMRVRIKTACDDEHQAWPGRARHEEHIGEVRTTARRHQFAADVDLASRQPPRPRRLALIDTDTHEILTDADI